MAHHAAKSRRSNKGVTTHAIQRAQERYGVTLPYKMWRELAASLGRGEHKKCETGHGVGTEVYEVLLLRADQSAFVMRVAFDAARQCIMTVLPPHTRENTTTGLLREANAGR